MNEQLTTRRSFVAAAVAFTTVASHLPSTAWLNSAAAWAESTGGSSELLARMGRLLFPHDGMADRVYAEVMDGVLAATADDPALAGIFRSAQDALDNQSEKPWLSLDEAEQHAALGELQHKSFFASILAAVRGHFYYHPSVWQYLDYPGSSKEYGGYLHRGFNDIDWLPEVG